MCLEKKRGAGWRRRNKKERVVAGVRGSKDGWADAEVNNGEQRRGQEEEQDRTGGTARPGRPGNKRGGDMCASK